MRRLVLCAFAISAALSCTSAETEPEDRAHAIEAQVWSPYCPGRLLIDCTTRQARELRGEIADRVRRGESEADVLGWIRTEYGDAAVARPEARGAGLALWLTPVAFFVFGIAAVVFAVRRWSTTGADGFPEPANADLGRERRS